MESGKPGRPHANRRQIPENDNGHSLDESNTPPSQDSDGNHRRQPNEPPGRRSFPEDRGQFADDAVHQDGNGIVHRDVEEELDWTVYEYPNGKDSRGSGSICEDENNNGRRRRRSTIDSNDIGLAPGGEELFVPIRTSDELKEIGKTPDLQAFVESLQLPAKGEVNLQVMTSSHLVVWSFMKTSGIAVDKLGNALAETTYPEASIQTIAETEDLLSGDGRDMFRSSTHPLLALSDECSLFSTKLAAVGAVQCYTRIIKRLDALREEDGEDRAASANFPSEQEPLYIIESSMIILHNIARQGTSQTKFQKSNTAEVIVRYTKCPEVRLAVIAMMLLAQLVDAIDNSRLMDRTYTIKRMLQFIEQALESTERTVSGFSAWEMTDALEKLAVNDDNKYKIIREGAIKPLLKMLQGDISKEQEVSANCLWTLAFKEEAREILGASAELVSTLEHLQKSSETPVPVKVAAKGALWMIRKQDVSAARSYNLSKSLPSPYQYNTGYEFTDYVFLSYSWNEQSLVLRIYETLKENGYKVWIDIHNFGGSSIMEAMAEGVANAAVVLLCVSDKYYESPNCRTEAEYAYKCGKDYIPLVVQDKFKPKKWLDALMGIRKYYDFYKIDSYEQIMDTLTRDMGSKGKEKSTRIPHAIVDRDENNSCVEERVEVPVFQTQKGSVFKAPRNHPSAEVSHPPQPQLPRNPALPPTPTRSIRNAQPSVQSYSYRLCPSPRPEEYVYNPSPKLKRTPVAVSLDQGTVSLRSVPEIRQWLTSYGLQRLVPLFQHYSATDFRDLNRIKTLAPETFHKCLREEFGLSLLEMIRFWRALSDI